MTAKNGESRIGRRVRRGLLVGLSVGLFVGGAGLLGGCTTRNVVLTNTSDTPMTLSSVGSSDGWDYQRTVEPGESFEMKVGAGQPISMPGMTVQVR